MQSGWKRLLLWGISCSIASALILANIPFLFGSPSPIIRITWRGVSTGDRVELERRFQLASPVALEDGVWGYSPTNTSPEILRALVRHPAVDRADGIDVPPGRLSRSLPLSPRRGGWIEGAPPWIAQGGQSPRICLRLRRCFGAHNRCAQVTGRAGACHAKACLRDTPFRSNLESSCNTRIDLERDTPRCARGVARGAPLR